MEFNIDINRKHLLYIVVITTIVGGVGLGVAFTTDGSGTPSIMGHSGDELNLLGTIITGDLDMNGYKITKLADPVELQDAVNLNTLQVALAQTGGGSMDLQGNIIFRDSSNNFGISTIPLSLPESGCTAIITVCDYGNNPPTQLIVGADPVPSSTNRPSKDNPSTGDKCGIDVSGTYTKPFGYAGYPTCAYTTQAYCKGTDVCVVEPGFTQCHCWYEDNGCRGARSYSYSQGTCCPSDHPIYDPTSGNCVKDTVISTNKVGQCSVLTTTFEAGLTDVTFADNNGAPLSTADYVAVSYSCPTT